jgi:hypothetical protein
MAAGLPTTECGTWPAGMKKPARIDRAGLGQTGGKGFHFLRRSRASSPSEPSSAVAGSGTTV